MTITKTCELLFADGEEGVAAGVLVGRAVADGLGRLVAVPWLQAERRHSRSAPATTDLTGPDITIGGAVRLHGGPWTLEMRPDRGCRITSLRLSGMELLEQGIGVDDPSAESFVAGGAAGWDEMVPNVDPGVYPGTGAWSGTPLPDHGEAWRLPWTVLDESGSAATTECSGRVLPWQLERRIELGDSEVRATYVYRNLGSQPLYAYWCAHPLFRYEAGMEIGLDDGARLAGLAEGTSEKRFLRLGTVDRARLGWRSGAAIELAWDATVTPYVGVWVCNGDLGGYRQIAIEPATGGGDRPHVAVPPPLLGPGGELRWWLEVRDAR